MAEHDQTWQGQDHLRIDRENREIEDVIAGRDSAVVAAARDREAAALQAAAEAPPTAEEAARRAIWEVAMDEAHERRVREGGAFIGPSRMSLSAKVEATRGRRARRQAAKARKRNDDGAGPSGHGGDGASPSGHSGGQ